MTREQIQNIVIKGECAKCGRFGELIGGIGGWSVKRKYLKVNIEDAVERELYCLSCSEEMRARR